jgi:hypothetical protein
MNFCLTETNNSANLVKQQMVFTIKLCFRVQFGYLKSILSLFGINFDLFIWFFIGYWILKTG